MGNKRREFLKTAALTGAAISFVKPGFSGQSLKKRIDADQIPKTWVNKQPGMQYRQLGRTGLMVSELVIGGGGVNPKRHEYLETALERGVNYIDTASRYGRGRSEEGIGVYMKKFNRRNDLIVATKLSSYIPALDDVCMGIYKGLPQGKQEAIQEKANNLIKQRQVFNPGYFFRYFPNQDNEINQGYLTHAILNEYGYLKKWKTEIRKILDTTVETSLERLQTDYIDILLCPHGARVPEELDDNLINEAISDYKRRGIVRFSGVSIHSDVPENLEKTVDVGYYDMAMVAYNIVNQGSMDQTVRYAAESGVGVVAMKAASAVNTPHDALKPIPDWRIEKLNQAISADLKMPLKAYAYVLQNPNISGVISAFRNEEMIKENLEIIGKKFDISYM